MGSSAETRLQKSYFTTVPKYDLYYWKLEHRKNINLIIVFSYQKVYYEETIQTSLLSIQIDKYESNIYHWFMELAMS